MDKRNSISKAGSQQQTVIVAGAIEYREGFMTQFDRRTIGPRFCSHVMLTSMIREFKLNSPIKLVNITKDQKSSSIIQTLFMSVSQTQHGREFMNRERLNL